MKKLICLLLVLTFCIGFACPAFATQEDDDFSSSPGTEPGGCAHDGETEVVGAKEASCTEEGYTGDVVCCECGEVIEEGHVIPKEPHRYVDGYCEVCGAKEAPYTGDDNAMGLWAGLMAVSAVGLVVLAVVSRKKNGNR